MAKAFRGNFVEVETVDEANDVDLSMYTFCERLSAKRGMYIFKIRASQQEWKE